MLAGIGIALDFPSTEEPGITIRVATVVASLPGASAERMETLIARPIEERIRELPEVDDVATTVRPGFLFTYVVLYDRVDPDQLPSVWQRMRAKLDGLQGQLPDGTLGPIVDDEFGRVSVLTLGLTGEDYSAGELRGQARLLRDRLNDVPRVERVSLHGVRDEQVSIVLDLPALLAAGLPPSAIAGALSERNIVAPAGQIEADGASLAVTVTGDARELDELALIPIALPNGGMIPLGRLAEIRREPVDPAQSAAFLNGQPGIVLAVSMDAGGNVLSFAETLREEIKVLSSTLPPGMQLVPITDQAKIVGDQLWKVSQVFVETTVIVLGVVVLFLGWRTGLIVGAIVPTTVLGTLLVMRLLGIELHLISIGAIIIALGLFVDNGIVVAEDMERRLANGEDRDAAAEAAGRTMFVPLLVSSFAIILTFMPLVLSQTDTGEYLRSLGIVVAVALLLSLVLAVTVTPLLCKLFAHQHHELTAFAKRIESLTGWYRGKVRWIISQPGTYVGAMLFLLVGAMGLFSVVPSELMPPSERRQLQMAIELPPDNAPGETIREAEILSRLLSDNSRLPEIASHALYVGEGGPRFILALDPPVPAAHRMYAVLTLADGYSHEQGIRALRRAVSEALPHARVEPKRFSMGASEAGAAVFRLIGPDHDALRRAADVLMAELGKEPGMEDVIDDAEQPVFEVEVDVDAPRAAASGTSSAGIAEALEATLVGTAISAYRDGDSSLPIVMRAPIELRKDAALLAGIAIPTSNGGSVPLGNVATLSLRSQPSVIQRRNQQRMITVSARHPDMTAQEIVGLIQPTIESLSWPYGHRVEIGGEIEEGAEADAAIERLLPLCMVGMFLMFLWQFGSIRKSLIVLASVPFVCIGAVIALLITGESLTFLGTLGLLALGGIIVNNAVLLIDAIDEERASGRSEAEAVQEAAAKRLRPIVMTKLVCILGLVPLWIFGGTMWTSLAVVMIGGLALGTLITLGLIPALYAIAFRIRVPA
jgi:multidrug efflux pump subunit AcrB